MSAFHHPTLSGLFGALAGQASPFGSVVVPDAAGTLAERAYPTCRALAEWERRRASAPAARRASPASEAFLVAGFQPA